jgi:precorrin-6B methylase 2
MNILRKIGRRLFKGTRWGPPLWNLYEGLHRRWEIKALSPGGWYQIDSGFPEIEPYYMYSDGLWPVERAKISGDYERNIAKELVQRANRSDVFWEIGAKYGYHSLMLAQLLDEVVAFEANPDFATNLREAIQKNEYENVHIVEGTVGTNVSLDDYLAPDLILMDIEGWEQDVLESVKIPLQSNATWIVEIHEKGSATRKHSNGEAVQRRFEKFGYSTMKMSERNERNYHLLAIPDREP